MSSVEVEYFRNKGSHDPENISGYLISLVPAKTSHVKTIWDEKWTEIQGSDFEPVAQLKTRLSVLLKSSPGIGTGII